MVSVLISLELSWESVKNNISTQKAENITYIFRKNLPPSNLSVENFGIKKLQNRRSRTKYP